MTSTSGVGARRLAAPSPPAAALRAVAAQPRPMVVGRARGHDAQVLQVPVEVRIDRVEVAERALVQLLQDRELDPLFDLDVCNAAANASTIAAGASGLPSVSSSGWPSRWPMLRLRICSSSWQNLLDDARDVARHHRLVHRRVSTSASLDASTLESRPSSRPCRRCARRPARAAAARTRPSALARSVLQRGARVEVERLLLAHVGAAGALDQHVADAVEHRRERQHQTMDGEVAAVAQNLRELARQRAAAAVDSLVGRSRCCGCRGFGRSGRSADPILRRAAAVGHLRLTDETQQPTVARRDNRRQRANRAASAIEFRPGLVPAACRTRERASSAPGQRARPAVPRAASGTSRAPARPFPPAGCARPRSRRRCHHPPTDSACFASRAGLSANLARRRSRPSGSAARAPSCAHGVARKNPG